MGMGTLKTLLFPGRTPLGSTWNPKIFYLEPKRVFLWGQLMNPFGTLISMYGVAGKHLGKVLSFHVTLFPSLYSCILQANDTFPLLLINATTLLPADRCAIGDFVSMTFRQLSVFAFTKPFDFTKPKPSRLFSPHENIVNVLLLSPYKRINNQLILMVRAVFLCPVSQCVLKGKRDERDHMQ